jgi:hypothetical protein
LNRPRRALAINLSQSFASTLLILTAVTLAMPFAVAQTSTPPAPTVQAVTPDLPASPEALPPPTGKVLFSRDISAAPESQSPANQPTDPQKPAALPHEDSLAVTDAERSALTFTGYDLDVHLTPAKAAISVRAGITVRNDSAAPLKRLILQITSTLLWDAISARTSSAPLPLIFATRLVATDADHTGQMSEAVLTLPRPLAPGASINLTALYSGTIPRSSERLQRIGAPVDQGLASDWDMIATPDPDGQTGGTALRGFGNVLWYPVSAPPIFLGEGSKFFQTVGAAKLRQSPATVRLRVAVEYLGDPPDAAFFCGRREQLMATSDNPNLPAAESPGIATALFAAQPLGFRTLSLFITAGAATNTGTSANPDLIAAVTGHFDALPAYSAAASQVEPLLADWFGPRPLTPLTILDHPGQPFEEDALLVRPMRAVDPATLVPSLVHSLTHAWIHSNHAWIDEGLAQFTSLLWVERTTGRPTALAQLEEGARSLALFEPANPTSSGSTSSSSSPESSSSSNPPEETTVPTASASISPAGSSLADATGEIFYRTKAAAVWWMLRTLLGDDALKKSLQAYRLDAKLDLDPAGLEHTLEKFAHQDLRWFFNDWVYRDRGLPDLSIVSVTPSQLEMHNGQPAAWLVAVVVRNDGYAEADVPVTVRSGTSSETRRIRIAGQSSASTRIVFAGTPDQVQLNDGSVPETQTSVHTRKLVLPDH